MKVIFLKKVNNVAEKNDIKEVSNGFALNYLLPQKLAIPASKEKIKEKDQQHQKISKLAQQIQKIKLEIKAKVNDQGHLFGGISNEDITKLLKEKHNLDIDKNKIDLDHHLKSLGEHKVNIKINNSESPTLKVIIKKENEKTK